MRFIGILTIDHLTRCIIYSKHSTDAFLLSLSLFKSPCHNSTTINSGGNREEPNDFRKESSLGVIGRLMLTLLSDTKILGYSRPLYRT